MVKILDYLSKTATQHHTPVDTSRRARDAPIPQGHSATTAVVSATEDRPDETDAAHYRTYGVFSRGDHCYARDYIETERTNRCLNFHELTHSTRSCSRKPRCVHYRTYFDRQPLLVRCGTCGDHLATVQCHQAVSAMAEMKRPCYSTLELRYQTAWFSRQRSKARCSTSDFGIPMPIFETGKLPPNTTKWVA